MGEDRQDRLGHSSGQRASVREAAEILGTTVDAIRKRVQRDTIPFEKASDGRVWIVLDAVQDSTGPRQDTGLPQSDSTALISEMVEELREEVHYLREQLHLELERRSDEAERYQQIVAALSTANASLSERLRELEPPQGTVPGPPQSTETVEEEPEKVEPTSYAAEAHEAPQEASEDAEAAEEQGRGQPHSATGGAQEPSEALGGQGSGTARGSLWRRIFGR